MKRIELFEFHRQSWLPADIREAIITFLESNDAEDTDEHLLNRIEERIGDREILDINGEKFHNKDSFLNMQSELQENTATFFSIHHLDTKEAHRLLTNAAWDRLPVAILATKRHPAGQLLRLTGAPFRALYFTLTTRPLPLSTFLLTAILPFIPFAAAWDQLAAWLRRYSGEEFQDMTEHIHVPGYRFKSGRIIEKGRPEIHYLIGFPELRKAA